MIQITKYSDLDHRWQIYLGKITLLLRFRQVNTGQKKQSSFFEKLMIVKREQLADRVESPIN